MWLVIWLPIKSQKPKTKLQNISETVESESEIPREKYLSLEQRHKIIDEIRLR